MEIGIFLERQAKHLIFIVLYTGTAIKQRSKHKISIRDIEDRKKKKNRETVMQTPIRIFYEKFYIFKNTLFYVYLNIQ